MFYKVVLPKNGIEFCQQLNCDINNSLATLYELVRYRTNILGNKTNVVSFVYWSEGTRQNTQTN